MILFTRTSKIVLIDDTFYFMNCVFDSFKMKIFNWLSWKKQFMLSALEYMFSIDYTYSLNTVISVFKYNVVEILPLLQWVTIT